MSTAFIKNNEKKMHIFVLPPVRFRRVTQFRCGLCGGELYLGDDYCHLDGQMVCELCLKKYARRHFSSRHQCLVCREKEET